MRRVRHIQRDLFDESTQVTELRLELRTKLSPLLETLLAEAAGMAPHWTKPDAPGGKEGDDD
jgi:hypothetical protein